MTERLFKWRLQEVLIEAPLYKEFDLSGIEEGDFAKFVLGGGGLDAYCIRCEQMSVFRLEGVDYRFDEEAKKIPKYGLVSMKAECTRHAENYWGKCQGELYFSLFRSDKQLIKIGQYPSKADLDFGSLDPNFSKELDAPLRQELGRAIGLHAHGIGVGSFIYLRRIFESLIEEALTGASSDRDWDASSYQRARMPERIKLLKAHLPNRLVETSKLYDILSKGVHELSEQDCLTHFAIVLKAILMILKERHEESEYKELVKGLNQGITRSETKQDPA
jgi:hypothetical protein